MEKIVRDKIPEIIMRDGKSCKIKMVSDTQAVLYLISKVAEELEEFRQSGDPEELADALEAIGFIIAKRGHSMKEIEEIRHKKFVERGGFAGNIILEMEK